jgi:hypothetical protein
MEWRGQFAGKDDVKLKVDVQQARKILVKTAVNPLNPESSGQFIILIERLSRLVGSGASRSRYLRRRAQMRSRARLIL